MKKVILLVLAGAFFLSPFLVIADTYYNLPTTSTTTATSTTAIRAEIARLKALIARLMKEVEKRIKNTEQNIADAEDSGDDSQKAKSQGMLDNVLKPLLGLLGGLGGGQGNQGGSPTGAAPGAPGSPTGAQPTATGPLGAQATAGAGSATTKVVTVKSMSECVVTNDNQKITVSNDKPATTGQPAPADKKVAILAGTYDLGEFASISSPSAPKAFLQIIKRLVAQAANAVSGQATAVDDFPKESLFAVFIGKPDNDPLSKVIKSSDENTDAVDGGDTHVVKESAILSVGDKVLLSLKNTKEKIKCQVDGQDKEVYVIDKIQKYTEDAARKAAEEAKAKEAAAKASEIQPLPLKGYVLPPGIKTDGPEVSEGKNPTGKPVYLWGGNGNKVTCHGCVTEFDVKRREPTQYVLYDMNSRSITASNVNYHGPAPKVWPAILELNGQITYPLGTE